MKLEVRNLRLPLSEFTLELEGDITSTRTAIFGPSGAGKTSLLESIARLAPGALRSPAIRWNHVCRSEVVTSR